MVGPRGFEPLPYGFEDRYDIHFTKDPLLAESIGIEPIHPLLSDGLAIRCLTARPTLRCYLAEAVRFELTELLHSSVFKTDALSRALPHFHFVLKFYHDAYKLRHLTLLTFFLIR